MNRNDNYCYMNTTIFFDILCDGCRPSGRVPNGRKYWQPSCRVVCREFKRDRERESSVCYCACSEDPVKKKSQGSLESSSRSEEDEGSDSLGVYEDVDPTKFNDEGSFIDQSGFKHVLQASTPDGTAVPPTAV